jgi:hypothetical protein
MEGSATITNDHPEAIEEPWDHFPLTPFGMCRLGSREFQPFPDFQVVSRRHFESTREHADPHADFDATRPQGPATKIRGGDESLASEAAPVEAVTNQLPLEHGTSPEYSDTSARPSLAQQLQQHLQTLQGLSKRAAIGDQGAIAEIQCILNDNEELWRYLGNVERTTEAMLVEYLSGPPEVRESVRRTTRELKRSLLTPDSTPLESLAVGRVVACWLFVNFVDRWS